MSDRRERDAGPDAGREPEEADDDRDPLDLIAEEYVTRLRAGESPSITEYAERHPDLAEELLDLLPSVEAIEVVKRKRDSTASAPLADVTPPERLGDFRIVREIGRGGMGVVFEAVQESLDRHVALKILPKTVLLDSAGFERFRHEARAAACLHHSNIVPVFGVGHEAGIHFYVMQFIDGEGLDVLIRRRKASGKGALSFRDVASIGMQVASALQHAHDQKTLHRDIKPANLLREKSGRIWVTDFGLAKLTEEEGVTAPGEVIGTLRYMAPERLEGRSAEGGDIYGLGVTLYELLALRPAFAATGRTKLTMQILHEEPPSIRGRRPDVPVDLETIILKTIERDPEQRYACASDLREDLERFLDGRPVLARRVSPIGKLLRWSTRNRAVASLSFVAVLLLSAVAIVSTIGFVSTRSANVEVRDALGRETVHREQAEATVELSLEAFEKIFVGLWASSPGGGVDDTSGVGLPVVSDEVASVLEGMLPFYDRLAVLGSDDPVLQLASARANRRVGDIRQRLGEFPEAHGAYDRAIELFESLPEPTLLPLSRAVEIASIHNELGKLQAWTHELGSSRDSHRRAVTLLRALDDDDARLAIARFELARSLGFLGRTRPGGGRPRVGRPGGGRPGVGRPPHHLRHRDDAADDYLEEAIGLLEGLIDEQPSSARYRFHLARLYRTATARPYFSRREIAKEMLERLTTMLEELVEESPRSPDFRYELAMTYAGLDDRNPSRLAEERPDAEARLERALKLLEELSRDFPNVPAYENALVVAHGQLADRWRRERRDVEAEACYRMALEIGGDLVKDHPDVATYSLTYERTRVSFAEVLAVTGRTEEARGILESVLNEMDSLLSTEPGSRPVRRVADKATELLRDLLRPAR